MVAWILTATLAALLAVAPVSAAPARQICLSCHPAHYAGLGSCTACHRGNPSSGRKNVAHQRLIAGRYARFTLADDALLREGTRLLEQYACRRCHVIGGRGNRLSANLDQATARRSPEELAVSIRQPVQSMPDFRLPETQVTTLINALLSAAGRLPSTPAVRPQVVHFDQGGETGKDVFSIKCGPCHRVLTERWGGLGRGDAGPNLSGLLTPHYPETFRNRERWTERNLALWIRNPRRVRSVSVMQPVRLTEAEFRELVDILKVERVGVQQRWRP